MEREIGKEIGKRGKDNKMMIKNNGWEVLLLSPLLVLLKVSKMVFITHPKECLDGTLTFP